MPQLHVVKRGSQYYFRIAVPLALVNLVGKRELKASLRTSDAISAKLRGRVLSNGLELLFRELRAMSSVSNGEIIERARAYLKSQLSKSLELAFLLPTDPQCDLSDEIAGTEHFTNELRAALASQQFSPSVLSDAQTLLDPNTSIIKSKASDTLTFACNAILRAKIENARILVSQLRGDYQDISPKDPWFAGLSVDSLPALSGDQPAASSTGPSFGKVAELFYNFKSGHDWAIKTAADVKRVIELASSLIGADKSMTCVDIDDVKHVRDALSSLPPNYMKKTSQKGVGPLEAISANTTGPFLSVKTQEKYFTMFKQLLIWAAREGYLEKVPGAGIKVAGVNKISPGEQRDPYSTEQLKGIFDSALYSGHKSKKARHKAGPVQTRDGYFWVPIIALHSGMRLGEIIQLLKNDIKNENGIWFFDVNKGEGKSLKTASSKRRIPIHRTLIELGLIKYIENIKPGDRIFMEINKGADGYHSHHFSKWWGRYVRHIGVKSERTAFHSFRHNFVDALRSAEVPDYINKALVGHAEKSVHGQYGGGQKLSHLKDSIEKVCYPLTFSFLLQCVE